MVSYVTVGLNLGMTQFECVRYGLRTGYESVRGGLG